MRYSPLLLLLLAQPAQAQYYRSCAPSYSYSYGYQPTYEYVREVYVPFSFPTPVLVDPRISYQYNGFNAVAVQGGVQAVTQQAAQQQQLAPQQGATRSGLSKDALKALVDDIEEHLRERSGKRPLEQSTPPPVPGAVSFKSEQTAEDVLVRNCSECHTAPRAKGRFTMFAEGGALAKGFNVAQALSAIEEGRMPPAECKTCTRLNAADKRLLKQLRTS